MRLFARQLKARLEELDFGSHPNRQYADDVVAEVFGKIPALPASVCRESAGAELSSVAPPVRAKDLAPVEIVEMGIDTAVGSASRAGLPG
eukprot:8325144-Lingulodinium_polyedra.AAC.1